MKFVFMQKRNLESIILDMMKVEGTTKEAALKELNALIKEVEPDAEVMILDEFTTRKY